MAAFRCGPRMVYALLCPFKFRHIAFSQLVHMIGIPLHHHLALLQVGALVIDAPDTFFDVGELRFDML